MGRSSGSRSSGGRSSGGFGGGRSSGGFSGGGRSSKSSFSSRPSNSSGGYHRPPRMSTGPIFIGGPRYYRRPRQRRSSNFGTVLAVFIVFMSFMVLYSFMMDARSEQLPQSTKQREPLSGVVHKTDWYEDELGWIRNERELITGLEAFYAQTGIQPYVVLLDYNPDYWMTTSINTTAADQFLEDLYEEKFTDEGHFIFAYFSCQQDLEKEMDGEFRYLSGYAADTIMDNEALSIFWGHFEKNYYDTSLSLEKMISKTFQDTGASIMDRPTNMYDVMKIVMIAGAGILVVFILYKRAKNAQQRQKEKETYTKEILNKPLETFGTDTSDLEEKYK